MGRTKRKRKRVRSGNNFNLDLDTVIALMGSGVRRRQLGGKYKPGKSFGADLKWGLKRIPFMFKAGASSHVNRDRPSAALAKQHKIVMGEPKMKDLWVIS